MDGCHFCNPPRLPVRQSPLSVRLLWFSVILTSHSILLSFPHLSLVFVCCFLVPHLLLSPHVLPLLLHHRLSAAFVVVELLRKVLCPLELISQSLVTVLSLCLPRGCYFFSRYLSLHEAFDSLHVLCVSFFLSVCLRYSGSVGLVFYLMSIFPSATKQHFVSFLLGCLSY